ncbi:putative auxin-responsive protein SAUR32 [Iris pallida]|uniref:Auxin-responsive protein SAUR32 n=1 Tax=Iris pallida TaxID=29817 RepID=A0AAX6I636_IRIPA|nr:putative auxin-responsive protein SAUR32 [Iris pallida]
MTHIDQDHKLSMRVKKGCIAVLVGVAGGGEDGFKRFVIPISHLYHPLFKSLLDAAREVYGYPSSGPLRLPCSVDDFLHIRWRVEREPSTSSSSSSHHHLRSHHHARHHHHHNSSFSLYSC